MPHVRICPRCQGAFDEGTEFCPRHGLALVTQGATMVAPARAPIAETLEGLTLDGRYQIEARIGEGGMGVVYRAHHRILEKKVAIKVLRPQVARDTTLLERFVTEAKAASRIRHPSIVDIHDFGTLPDGGAYFVMDYFAGPTLAQALRQSGPMPAARAVGIMMQLGRALAAAHERQVVHRDLKPDNIFVLDEDGRADVVKIVDFGIAKLLSDDESSRRLTMAGAVFGTPEYMAPEQASGLPDLDHRVDIHALGAIFYELVVGKVPLQGRSPLETLAMQLRDPIVPPLTRRPEIDLSPALEAIIMKALARDRNARHATMNEFIAELMEVTHWGETSAVHVTAGARTGAIAAGPVAFAPSVVRAPAPKWSPMARTIMPEPAWAARLGGLDAAPETPVKASPRMTPSDNDVGGTTRVTPAPSRFGLLARALALAVLGAASVMVFRQVSRPASNLVDAAPPAPRGDDRPDAGPATLPDAAPSLSARDAAVTRRPPDARAASPRPPVRDPVDAAPRVVAPPRLLTIAVATEPAGAKVTLDGRDTVDGAAATRPLGATLSATCELGGHEPGRVTLLFDGSANTVVCRMNKRVRCVPGLKDPFGNWCPDAGVP